MISVHHLAYKLSDYFVRKLFLSPRERDVLAYGLELILGETWKLLVLVVIGFLLNCVVEVMVVWITWVSVRIYSGGSHCTTFTRCLVFGHALLVGIVLLARALTALLPQGYLPVFLITSVLGAFYLIIKWAPADTPNKPLDRPEDREKFRRATFTVFFVWSALLFLSFVFNLVAPVLLVTSACALLAQSWTLSPPAYRLIDGVDRILGKILP